MQELQPFDKYSIIAKLREAINYAHIEDISRYIIHHQHLDILELTKAFDEFIIDIDDLTPLQLKLNIFEVMSAILLTEARGKFIRHFVTRIYSFLNKYSILISEFSELSHRVLLVFKKWEENSVFAKDFHKKLHDLANSIFYCHSEKPQYFKKYSQNFLVCLRDVQKVECTKLIYDTQVMKIENEKRSNDIREEMKNLETATDREEDKKERAKILKSKVETTIESLSHILELNKDCMNHLCAMIVKEQTALIKKSDFEQDE